MLEGYFEDFMRFFFPTAARNIEWSKKHIFLDQELSQIVRDAKIGKRFADNLLRFGEKMVKRSGY